MSKTTVKRDTESDKRVVRRDSKGCWTVKNSAGRSLSQADSGSGVIRSKDSAASKDTWTEADRAMFRAWDKVHENRGRK